MLPPAAYILINQTLRAGHRAIRQRRGFYDAGGLADYPDFWQNVSDAAKGMLVFGLYHPKMAMPELGKKVADAYKAKTKNEPSRLLFQAADSLFIVTEAIKAANSAEPDAIIKAIEGLKWSGTRGEIHVLAGEGRLQVSPMDRHPLRDVPDHRGEADDRRHHAGAGPRQAARHLAAGEAAVSHAVDTSGGRPASLPRLERCSLMLTLDLVDQRADHRRVLRADGDRPVADLRHSEDRQFRPWRVLHGGRIRLHADGADARHLAMARAALRVLRRRAGRLWSSSAC